MFEQISANVNAVDIFTACIFARCVYKGGKKGFVVEIFKLFGMIVATFVTLHYYARLVQFLPKKIMSVTVVSEPMSFVLLWFGIVVTFKFIREGYMLVSKTGSNTALSKWGGTILAVPRAAMVCGLAFLLMFVSGNRYLVTKIQASWAGASLVNLSTGIYRASYSGFVRKVFPGEKKNTRVFALREKVKR